MANLNTPNVTVPTTIDFNGTIDYKRKSENPQRTYLWSVGLPQINTPPASTTASGLFNILTKKTAAAPSANDVVGLIKSVSASYAQFQVGKQAFQNSSWNYAQTNNTDNLTLSFDEDQNGTVFNYFQTWQQCIVNSEDGTYYPPIAYKKPVGFMLLDTFRNVLSLDIYEGCFPTSIGNLSLDYETSGIVSYNVVLSVDGVYSRTSYVAQTSATAEQYTSEILSATIAQQPKFAGIGKAELDATLKMAFSSLTGLNL